MTPLKILLPGGFVAILAAMFKTQDLHVREIVRLSSPRTVKDLFPALPESIATVVQSRERITRILRQADPRLLVVVGP